MNLMPKERLLGRVARPGVPSKSQRGGSALILVLTVLALMTVLLVANAKVVWHLNRDLRLIEKRQIQHWTKVGQNKPGAGAGAQPGARQ